MSNYEQFDTETLKQMYSETLREWSPLYKAKDPAANEVYQRCEAIRAELTRRDTERTNLIWVFILGAMIGAAIFGGLS